MFSKRLYLQRAGTQWRIRRASFRAADATKLLLLIFSCFAAFSISICSWSV